MAIKSWFDFLFAAGNVPYGLGFIAVLCADMRRSDPLLPRLVSYVGIAIGAAAAISGLGAALGVLHLPLVIGLSVHVRLRDSRRARTQDRADRSSRRAMTGGSPR